MAGLTGAPLPPASMQFPRASEDLMCCQQALQAEGCVVHTLGLPKDSGVRRACGGASEEFVDMPVVPPKPVLVRLRWV